MNLTAQQKLDVKATNEIRPVLRKLGLTLAGYGPGVQAYKTEFGFHSGMLNFDALEWGWLWPLLVELVNRREEHPDNGFRCH